MLEYGKLLLLSFYYDFLCEFIPFEDFCLIEMDTDSAYLAFATKSMFLAVPVHKRPKFLKEYVRWFAKSFCDRHKDSFFQTMFEGKDWVPEDCCKAIELFDSRTIGLLHTEWTGNSMIALCSKCYYCSGEKNKLSSKGLSKKHNSLAEEDYKNVLMSQSIQFGTNRGFRVLKNQLFTYNQFKKGLNYMYGKRIVCDDHVTTLPTHL